MTSYKIALDLKAQKDIAYIKRTDKKSFMKLEKLLVELHEHPYTGTGSPEQLKHTLSGFWSRKINKKDRLLYQIDDIQITVRIVSAKGHYGDK